MNLKVSSSKQYSTVANLKWLMSRCKERREIVLCGMLNNKIFMNLLINSTNSSHPHYTYYIKLMIISHLHNANAADKTNRRHTIQKWCNFHFFQINFFFSFKHIVQRGYFEYVVDNDVAIEVASCQWTFYSLKRLIPPVL